MAAATDDVSCHYLFQNHRQQSLWCASPCLTPLCADKALDMALCRVRLPKVHAPQPPHCSTVAHCRPRNFLGRLVVHLHHGLANGDLRQWAGLWSMFFVRVACQTCPAAVACCARQPSTTCVQIAWTRLTSANNSQHLYTLPVATSCPGNACIRRLVIRPQ